MRNRLPGCKPCDIYETGLYDNNNLVWEPIWTKNIIKAAKKILTYKNKYKNIEVGFSFDLETGETSGLNIGDNDSVELDKPPRHFKLVGTIHNHPEYYCPLSSVDIEDLLTNTEQRKTKVDVAIDLNKTLWLAIRCCKAMASVDDVENVIKKSRHKDDWQTVQTVAAMFNVKLFKGTLK